MLDTNNPEIQFAIDAVRQASLLVKTVQAEMVSAAIQKDDRSPVTVADFAAQALVGQMLSTAYPQDAMIGEEDSTSLRSDPEILARITQFVARFAPDATPKSVCKWIDLGSTESAARYWTLDPIDGTKGFLRGDQYAVAFALVYDGQVQVGALGCPNLSLSHLSALTPPLSRGERESESPSPPGRGARGEGGSGTLLIAARNQGAWITPIDGDGRFSRIKVSSQTDPAQARLLRSFEPGHTNVNKIDVLAEEMGVRADPVRMDSQAKYAVLAAGLGEIYLRLLSPSRPNYREKIWDQAAGSIITEEAGGRVSDLDGKALDFTQGRTLAQNRGICGTNGVLHQDVLEIIKRIGA